MGRIKRLTVPLKVDIRGIYNIEPRHVILRSVTPGESFKGVLKVSSAEDIELVGFEATDGNSHISVTHRPGDEPNTVVFDAAIADNPEARLLRDTWQLRILARGEEYVEKVAVLAVIEPKTLDADAVERSAVAAGAKPE